MNARHVFSNTATGDMRQTLDGARQRGAHPRLEALAGGLDPLEHRGAVHAVHRCELGGAHLVKVTLAEEVALADVEAGDRLGEGRLHERAVGVAQVGELGVALAGHALEEVGVALSFRQSGEPR